MGGRASVDKADEITFETTPTADSYSPVLLTSLRQAALRLKLLEAT